MSVDRRGKCPEISGIVVVVFLLAAVTALPALAGLDAHLQDLAPYVGKTFQGEFTDAVSGKKSVDVQVWEEMLGGKAIRITHSLNEGQYGGESIVFWDGKIEQVAFYYFTTAGFFTHGTMKLEDGAFTAVEKVEGGAGGITEVRSSSTRLEDGRLHMKSEYLKDGQWTPGHEIFYEENPEAELIFQ
jgi:hypothetical protein